jgi:hypothetical protein
VRSFSRPRQICLNAAIAAETATVLRSSLASRKAIICSRLGEHVAAFTILVSLLEVSSPVSVAFAVAVAHFLSPRNFGTSAVPSPVHMPVTSSAFWRAFLPYAAPARALAQPAADSN